MLEPAVENIIMYIPVEDATAGGIPILSRSGLKIAPPPSPNAPDTQPPKRAKMTNLPTIALSNLTSDLARPLPTFFLSCYSELTLRIP